jgi:transcription antitermination factor NusG
MFTSETASEHYTAERFSTANSEWYPLQVRYQCEKRVDDFLRAEGFDAFSPMWRQTRRWSDRTKVVDAPLFPGYTFVRMEALPDLLVKVLRVPGMVRFVTSGRDLVPIATEEIDAIRALMHSDPACAPGPFPAVGEKIRIRGGCLEGMEGILTADAGQGEIVISVGVIQRSIKVPLGAYQVERLS